MTKAAEAYALRAMEHICLLSKHGLPDAVAEAFDAGLAQGRKEAEGLTREMQMAANALDSIKFELYASVYTLEDDEFETTFFARDCLMEALAEYRHLLVEDKSKEGNEK